jgi:hypothetical protein
MKNILLSAVFTLLIAHALCQVTYEDNNPLTNPIPLGYLGWNDNTNTNLNILQNNTLRERFTSVNFAGHNGSNAVNNASRMFLGLNGGFQNPFSMIHMGSNITNFLQRPWMNVGITMGASQDILHLGILQRAMPGSDANQIDAVLAWGCNDDIYAPFAGPDNFRFLFIAPTNGTGDGAAAQGRETMRITPMGNVGIGDFSHMTNGLNEQPTQKLDVDGTARLRQMPTNEEFDVVITGKYAESPGVNGDYVLNYSTITDFTEALNIECDWNVVNSGNHVAMGYSGACTPGKVLVGFGTAPVGNTAKVILTKSYSGPTLYSEAIVGGGASEIAADFIAGNATNNRGIKAVASTAGNRNYGVDALAERAGTENFGINGVARDGRNNYGVRGNADMASSNNYGVFGLVRSSTQSQNNVGVYGYADGLAVNYNFGGYFKACGSAKHIGIYAEVCDTSGNAGYFVGNIVSTQPAISLSDETIKTNINEIESALQIIEQLEPVNYNFNTEAFPHLNLSTSLNYGFRAQQVQEVLPSIVKQIVHPAQNDSLGNEISPEENLLGIEYQQLIPIYASPLV